MKNIFIFTIRRDEICNKLGRKHEPDINANNLIFRWFKTPLSYCSRFAKKNYNQPTDEIINKIYAEAVCVDMRWKLNCYRKKKL